MSAPHGGAPDRSEGEARASEQSGRAAGASDRSIFAEPAGDLSIRIGREQIDIESRWEAASILNDIMTGLWFISGSVVNLVTDYDDLPIYLYLAGSSQLLLRAFLRLGRRIHVSRGYSPSKPRVYRPDVDG